jgi:HEPN domain-containing protein
MEHETAVEWFQYADIDLATAEYLKDMQPQPLNIICYHSQQSVEKYLKGYLFFNGVEQPLKTHDLTLLCEMCYEYNDKFSEIKRACFALNRYSVQPRYPSDMEITNNDMHKALEYARKVRDFKLFKHLGIS